MSQELSNKPTVDPAEHNAFFPSELSLSQFTSPTVALDGDEYPVKYQGKKRILVITADERYYETDNGSYFSTGNHPVETLAPLHHLDQAGFTFDIATLSGLSTKFEFWAFPKEQPEIVKVHEKYLEQFKHPIKLGDIAQDKEKLSEYIAVFVPGGHGALCGGIPTSKDVADVLDTFVKNGQYVISICHGPAAFNAPAVHGMDTFKDIEVVAFPDNIDRQTPGMGYMPGGLTWFFGEALTAAGVKILNGDTIDGRVHSDKKVITGDSPYASNNLGKLAAKTLLEDTAAH